MGEKGRICVTGGGGYQASWLIKLLLFKGYKVQATVREPEAEKNVHLKTFQGASENLQLFKAELLDYDTIFAAIDGCTGVFHVATPVQQDTIPNAEVEIVGTAVTGTLNVLRACSMAKVKRLVVVSSMTAVIYNPNWPRGQPMDESCWSDQETCRTAEAKFKYNMYYLSKTISESKALEYSKETGLDVVTVCPSHILGPALGAPSPSALYIYTILKDMLGNLENKVRNFVDVRDVADALLLVYEKPEAKGRYICSAHKINVRNLVDKLKSMCPNCNLPKVCNVDEDWDLTSEKLLNLGWNYRVLEETLAHTIENFQETGMLEGNIYNT